MAIYNKSIEPARKKERKKAKIRFTNDLECHFLFSEDRLPMAYASS
ncbi:hypothetical protein M101_0929 [Bacteroides fragilis str. 1007-1-F |nr:hypothetical protein M101_0929 [Bacteroides fragilis str. 1007-1-F \